MGEGSYRWDRKRRFLEHQIAQFEERVPDGGYDAVGNLLTKSRTDSKGEIDWTFRYNDLNQLVDEANDTHTAPDRFDFVNRFTDYDPNVHHTYSYDSIHNRLSVDSAECKHDALNQLLSQGEVQYQYDACGNRLQRSEGTSQTAYCYDALGRLTQFTKGSRAD